MKNIHILPTDKSSRLYCYKSIELYLHPTIVNANFSNLHYKNYNIYITNDEEIKKGDWCINPKNNKVMKVGHHGHHGYSSKKIILTTDVDLIEDGVQAIDDEFLEWFVKNPSCEEVEIEKVSVMNDRFILNYEIIIPKEESKQETLTNDTDSHSWGFENFEVIKTEEDVKIFVETMENIPEPNNKLKKAFRDFNKQETLEEVALNYAKLIPFVDEITTNNSKLDFIAGAKWQQEQDKKMYSEEEVKHLMTLAFEQGFKKADIVEAGLEAKETDTEINWIFLKHKK